MCDKNRYSVVRGHHPLSANHRAQNTRHHHASIGQPVLSPLRPPLVLHRMPPYIPGHLPTAGIGSHRCAV